MKFQLDGGVLELFPMYGVPDSAVFDLTTRPGCFTAKGLSCHNIDRETARALGKALLDWAGEE